MQNQQLSKQDEFTGSSRDPHVQKDAFHCPAFGSKKHCYSKRWISLKRELLFPHNLWIAYEIMGLRWPAVFAFITHSSLWNHCTTQFLFQLSEISALRQLISNLFPTPIPISRWFHLLLMDQSSYPFHISAAPVQRGDCLRFFIPLGEQGYSAHTAVPADYCQMTIPDSFPCFFLV